MPSKLRLKYQRRPCKDVLNNIVCQEPDPPHADFPNGWGGFSDLLHVDFKFPSEHRILGEAFDGEMQIYHLHDGRRRLPVISVLMRAGGDDDSTSHNDYLQAAIDAFQYEYDTNMAHCAGAIAAARNGDDGSRRHRRLGHQDRNRTKTAAASHQHPANNNSASETLINATFGSYESFDRYARLLEKKDDGSPSDFVDERDQHHHRRMSGIWYPYHEALMPTYYFYGYDGSLTEPPCTGTCSNRNKTIGIIRV